MCDVISHTLGFPRMGVQRELKKALEAYWAGKASEEELRAVGSELRSRHWAEQDRRGVRLLPAGDFAWYDSTLATSFLLGNIAPRHLDGGEVKLDTLFRAGRGRAPTGQPTSAAEMTKWFNTNYHYMVPEFTSPAQTFSVTWRQLFDEVREAAAVYGAQRVKPVLLGPVSYLHLGKVKSEEKFDRIALLPNLVKAYAAVLSELAEIGVEWVQVDEPVLVLDLDASWQAAYEAAYAQLREAAPASPKLLLTTYFDSVSHHLDLITRLPVDGLHVDFVNGADSLAAIEQALPQQWVLSAGVVSGRNIWKTDLSAWYPVLRDIRPRRSLWVAPSCSLLHCPVDLSCETLLDAELKGWLAFAVQKCDELQLLARALNDGSDAAQAEVAAYSAPVIARQSSERVVRAEVRARVSGLTDADSRRSQPFLERREKQRERFHLPLWPTTTIGSFPQTASIRTQRQSFRKGQTDEATYHAQLREHIEFAVRQQENLDLDVLVHGEAERSDMVEYFGELLEGFAFTQNGWVQSYGSRCVKPPIIYGDVNRPHAMTVPWSAYAQSLTSRPMKGMLTGPVTILCWSFPREDVTREHIAQQLALALRDEVADLEAAGIHMIQVDEPALREGLPLQKHKWAEYLDWAARAFRIAVSVAQPATQVHTHMCYAEVNEIMSTIVAMDADVISLEASRSDMELLDAFEHSTYPNEIGPGVYDIHSPNIPTVKAIVALLRSAATRVPVDQLWVNPDCGLKTRTWPEVNEALANMVAAAKQLRADSR